MVEFIIAFAKVSVVISFNPHIFSFNSSRFFMLNSKSSTLEIIVFVKSISLSKRYKSRLSPLSALAYAS